MSPSLPGTVFARTHALAQTVGGTLRISKDSAVSCAGARLCAPARGKEEQKNGSVTREKGRERAEPPREKNPLASRPHWDAAFSCLQPVGETCQYPVLFFTECFIYLPQRRRFAVVITPGVQLDTNVNQLEGKQLAPKVLSLFSTQQASARRRLCIYRAPGPLLPELSGEKFKPH